MAASVGLFQWVTTTSDVPKIKCDKYIPEHAITEKSVSFCCFLIQVFHVMNQITALVQEII